MIVSDAYAILRDLGALLPGAAYAVILAYAAVNAAARLGKVPEGWINWWQDRWVPYQREVQRNKTIDEAVAEVPVLVVAVKDLTATVHGIVLEMHPNSGSSLRDAVDRIATGQTDLTTKLNAHMENTVACQLAVTAHLASASQHRREP